MDFGPPETHQESRDQWLHDTFLDQLAPENYAGEGMYSTEEYPIPDPGMDPWTQSRIGQEGDEWPAPRGRR